MNSVQQNAMNLMGFLRVDLQLIHTQIALFKHYLFCQVFIRKFVTICNCQGCFVHTARVVFVLAVKQGPRIDFWR